MLHLIRQVIVRLMELKVSGELSYKHIQGTLGAFYNF